MQQFIASAPAIIAWIVACYLIADFLTGVIHWAEDTWLVPGRSALLDRYVVLDNLEHHRRPGRIRGGSYWLTNRPSLVIAATLAAGLACCDARCWQAYLVLAFASQGNQVHKWAHSSRRPVIVARLQEFGILQSRGHHGRHHRSPYAVHYCAMTDFLNPILDATGFWRGLEALLVGLGATNARGSAARDGY